MFFKISVVSVLALLVLGCGRPAVPSDEPPVRDSSASSLIWGYDDRTEMYDVNSMAVLAQADSVVSILPNSATATQANGTTTLSATTYGVQNNLCSFERFQEQPAPANCSGFLVAPRLIATAGHCVNASNLSSWAFVFGFRMTNASTAVTVVPTSEVYHGVTIVGRAETSTGADWAVVRLDRVVPNHAPLPIRTSGQVANTTQIHMLGHPKGLPLKYTPGAFVLGNTNNYFFESQLDAYAGNSGSPVFNSATHVVEGILVRGPAVEFVSNGTCRVSRFCQITSASCPAIEANRIIAIAAIVAAEPAPIVACSPVCSSLVDPYGSSLESCISGQCELTRSGAIMVGFYWTWGRHPLLTTATEFDSISALLPNWSGATSWAQFELAKKAAASVGTAQLVASGVL